MANENRMRMRVPQALLWLHGDRCYWQVLMTRLPKFQSTPVYTTVHGLAAAHSNVY